MASAGGRKRKSPVWEYFLADPDNPAGVVCQIKETGTERRCGFKLKASNTGNMESHLVHHHPDAAKEVAKKRKKDADASGQGGARESRFELCQCEWSNDRCLNACIIYYSEADGHPAGVLTAVRSVERRRPSEVFED